MILKCIVSIFSNIFCIKQNLKFEIISFKIKILKKSLRVDSTRSHSSVVKSTSKTMDLLNHLSLNESTFKMIQKEIQPRVLGPGSPSQHIELGLIYIHTHTHVCEGKWMKQTLEIISKEIQTHLSTYDSPLCLTSTCPWLSLIIDRTRCKKIHLSNSQTTSLVVLNLSLPTDNNAFLSTHACRFYFFFLSNRYTYQKIFSFRLILIL